MHKIGIAFFQNSWMTIKFLNLGQISTEKTAKKTQHNNTL